MKTIILFLFLSLNLFAQSSLLTLFDSEVAVIPNLLNDEGFDNTPAVWQAGLAWTISDSKANYNNLTNASALSQQDGEMVTSIAINTNYNLSFDISGGVADIWVLSYAAAIAYINRTTYAVGHHSIDFTTGGDVSTGGINFYTFINEAFSIDNVRLTLR